jgi:coenzyme PQQ precursor peptide PqqA
MQKRKESVLLANGLSTKKTWNKPFFKTLRLGFEITMYFWTK